MDTQIQTQIQTQTPPQAFEADASQRLLKLRYGIATPLPPDTIVARSLLRYGEWMEHELDLLGSFLGSDETVLEFGGEYAAHALWLARVVGDCGSVHIVEPRRLDLQKACANLALNGVTNAYAHAAWLGREGEAPARGREQGDNRRSPTVSLDSLELDSLHLLKINLPGTLAPVLQGADETLRRHRPVIYLRLGHDLEQALQEVRALKECGYRCWSHLPYLFNPDNFAGSEDNLFPGQVQQNLVAVPMESRLAFDRLREI